MQARLSFANLPCVTAGERSQGTYPQAGAVHVAAPIQAPGAPYTVGLATVETGSPGELQDDHERSW